MCVSLLLICVVKTASVMQHQDQDQDRIVANGNNGILPQPPSAIARAISAVVVNPTFSVDFRFLRLAPTLHRSWHVLSSPKYIEYLMHWRIPRSLGCIQLTHLLQTPVVTSNNPRSLSIDKRPRLPPRRRLPSSNRSNSKSCFSNISRLFPRALLQPDQAGK